MPLMDRIKCIAFLDMPLADQTNLVRSVQLLRNKSLKEAKIKKVRAVKTKTVKAKSKSKTKPKESKIAKSLDKLDAAQLLELAAKHGIKL